MPAIDAQPLDTLIYVFEIAGEWSESCLWQARWLPRFAGAVGSVAHIAPN
jgi:hypothetical protein